MAADSPALQAYPVLPTKQSHVFIPLSIVALILEPHPTFHFADR
jgi:hypothetical protein